MFHSAALKLTLWYLAIIMSISVVFSFSLYRVSSTDLHRNVNRQIAYFNNILGPTDSFNYSVLRNRQVNEDLRHLKANLVLFNFLVLVSGGAASYWLARRTLQPIEEALINQSRFASDASHELRTPLTAIQTENEVALRNKNLTKSEAVKLLRSNLEEIDKLKNLSEGLLSLAQGTPNINSFEPVSLKDVAQAAVERYQKAATSKRVRLANKAAGINVQGDRVSLIQLLSILIDNAIKYSPAGNQVKISTGVNRNSASIMVADSGQGIKPGDLPYIFDRFYRADSSRSKDGSTGYGLGLAIAKKIITAHKGHIEVASTHGAGTTFSVFLPRS